MSDAKTPRCTFCGKSMYQVRLVAGPGVFICHECVDLCQKILTDAPQSAVSNPASLPADTDKKP